MELALFQPDIPQNTGTIFRARVTLMRHDPGDTEPPGVGNL